MDAVWLNLRYTLIAAGVALAAQVCNGCIGTPVIEQAVGFAIVGLTYLWGNYVKLGTTAVPDKTAARADVPTVSPVTGAVIPANASKK